MQLVDQKRRGSQEELSPAIYAALVDSLFQNFWPMFIGLGLRRRRRGHDGAQDRQRAAVAVRALLIVHRHASAPSRCAVYERRTAVLTFDAGRALGTALSDRRHDLCRCARRLVLHHPARQRRRRRAHDLRRRDDRLHRRRRGPQLRPSVDLPVCRSCWPAVRCRWRWRCMAIPIYIGLAVAAGAVLRRPQGHQPQPARASSSRR